MVSFSLFSSREQTVPVSSDRDVCPMIRLSASKYKQTVAFDENERRQRGLDINLVQIQYKQLLWF